MEVDPREGAKDEVGTRTRKGATTQGIHALAPPQVHFSYLWPLSLPLPSRVLCSNEMHVVPRPMRGGGWWLPHSTQPNPHVNIWDDICGWPGFPHRLPKTLCLGPLPPLPSAGPCVEWDSTGRDLSPPSAPLVSARALPPLHGHPQLRPCSPVPRTAPAQCGG